MDLESMNLYKIIELYKIERNKERGRENEMQVCVS